MRGTGSNLENFENVAEKAKDLQDKASVTFAWLGGDFPDGAEAGSAAHAVALAPGLASFTHQVRQELTHAESPASAEITLEGHSYGGAVVGYTENHSPDAQTVLHIESAGMGHDIFTPEDLPASQEDVVRYSMTAPDDWIAPIQGAQEHSSAMTSAGTAITASNPATIGLVFPWNDVAPTLGHGAPRGTAPPEGPVAPPWQHPTPPLSGSWLPGPRSPRPSGTAPTPTNSKA